MFVVVLSFFLPLSLSISLFSLSYSCVSQIDPAVNTFCYSDIILNSEKPRNPFPSQPVVQCSFFIIQLNLIFMALTDKHDLVRTLSGESEASSSEAEPEADFDNEQAKFLPSLMVTTLFSL
jgi:hypothetical protein